MSSIFRKLKRQQQVNEIKHSYCRKCGSKLTVKNGKAHCKHCNVDWGKVSDRK